MVNRLRAVPGPSIWHVILSCLAISSRIPTQGSQDGEFGLRTIIDEVGLPVFIVMAAASNNESPAQFHPGRAVPSSQLEICDSALSFAMGSIQPFANCRS